MSEQICVKITVEGGVIQDIEKPDNVKVEVLDFDAAEGAGENDPRVRKNEKGERYWYTVW